MTVLISVVMPCYNAKAHIAESVRSALSQTHRNLELIAVDDGSQDDTLTLLHALAARDSRLRVIRQPNLGPGPARNRGLREARGAYVAFLDADDYWAEDCLEKLLAKIESAHADLAYCGWQNVGWSGGSAAPFVPPDYADVDKVELMLGGCRWPIHSALTRRSVIDAAGGFNERWATSMDYDLWLRLAPFCKIVRVAEVLAFYRHHMGPQITKNLARIAINHWLIQEDFVAHNSGAVRHLDRRRLRELIYGELLRKGLECYWAGNLEGARTIFRIVMKVRYGRIRDWKYMLPALLPLPMHRAVLRLRRAEQ